VEPPKEDTSLEVDESPKTRFRRMGGWEDYTHQGILYLFTDRMKREYLAPMNELLNKYPELHCGVSLTYKHGMVISVLGNSVWELQQLLDEAWLLLKEIAV
jgi:urease accessory protein